MRLALAILFLFSQLVVASFTNVVPRARTIVDFFTTNNCYGVPWDWRTNWIPATNVWGISSNGSADASSDINTAIANVGNWALSDTTHSRVVYVPAGTYRLDNPITINGNNLTLRGDTNGGVTKFVVNFVGQNGIYLGTDNNYGSNNLFSGYTLGSSNIVTSWTNDDRGIAWSVGDYAFISQTDDTNFVMRVGAGPTIFPFDGTAFGTVTRITAVSQVTNLSIWPPITWNFKSSLTPCITQHRYSIRTNCGIENIFMDVQNGGTNTFTIYCEQQWGFHVSGCTITNSRTKGLIVDFCLQGEIFHNNINNIGGGVANTGVGFESFHGMGWCMVYDNQFTGCYQAVQMDDQNCCNAFLYNWSGAQSINGSTFVADDFAASHGNGGSFNLYEGNSAATFDNDPTHGTHSHDIFFRNWAHAYYQDGPAYTQQARAFQMGFMCYSNSIVANICGAANFPIASTGSYLLFTNHPLAAPCIYVFGTPQPGNYDWGSEMPPLRQGGSRDNNVYSNDVTIIRANYIMGNAGTYVNQVPAVESIGSTNLESSLFFSVKPAWYSNYVWPPFGPDVSGFTNVIPAEARWYGIAQPVTSYGPTGSRARGIKLRR